MRKILVIRRKGKLKTKSRAVLQLQYENRKGKKIIREYPLRDLDAVLIIGKGVVIESAVPPILASMNIPLAIVAENAASILVNPVVTLANNYRHLQHTMDKTRALEIALQYLEAKIGGMTSILRYYRAKTPPIPMPPTPGNNPALFEREIRLWEATTSNTLWDTIITIIKPEHLKTLQQEYGFQGRKPKHPDPFNKTLSTMYAVIYSLATRALLAAGLDPTYGFLHRTRYSTPLVFDYTEMFKPIAIHATIDLINTQGLPELEEDQELTRDSVNQAIRKLYEYLTLRHTKTRKTPYQYIFLKAYCLAKHLENKCPKTRLTITWDRKNYH